MKLDVFPSAHGASLNDVIKVLCQVDDITEKQFTAFRKFYNEITQFDQTGDVSIAIDHPNNLSSHTAVLRAVARLRSHCNEELELFKKHTFQDSAPKDQERAARDTVQLAFMIDPFSRDNYPMICRIENEHVFPVKWLPNQTFVQFFRNAFPTESLDCWDSSTKTSSLTAWKLKRLGIKIFPTNDLAEHLVYDPRNKRLKVFHQVEYLKAQVLHTAERSLDETLEMSFTKLGSVVAEKQVKG